MVSRGTMKIIIAIMLRDISHIQQYYMIFKGESSGSLKNLLTVCNLAHTTRTIPESFSTNTKDLKPKVRALKINSKINKIAGSAGGTRITFLPIEKKLQDGSINQTYIYSRLQTREQ